MSARGRNARLPGRTAPLLALVRALLTADGLERRHHRPPASRIYSRRNVGSGKFESSFLSATVGTAFKLSVLARVLS